MARPMEDYEKRAAEPGIFYDILSYAKIKKLGFTTPDLVKLLGLHFQTIKYYLDRLVYTDMLISDKRGPQTIYYLNKKYVDLAAEYTYEELVKRMETMKADG